jgi:hypothetical protein
MENSSLMAAHITITAYVAIAVCVAEQTGKQPSCSVSGILGHELHVDPDFLGSNCEPSPSSIFVDLRMFCGPQEHRL